MKHNRKTIKMFQASRHEPVLLKEVIQYLDPRPGDFIIDGTVDGGGHAAAIIEKIAPSGNFLGVDWDKQIIETTSERLKANSLKLKTNLILLSGNYADLPEILRERDLGKAEGLLIDLGFSSEQLEQWGRGFSFGPAAAEEPLLMTYSDEREPVRNILRRLNEREIADIIFKFGGERYSRRIAKAIKERSGRTLIKTSGELAEIVRNSLPKNYERGRINPATRTFQALRIYANDELGNLKKVLGSLEEILKPGGRAVVISFHSLEDKIVKEVFREMAKTGTVELITKKPVAASDEEIDSNPRSRSAKLRAIKMF